MRLRPYVAADLSVITDIGADCNTRDALSMYITRDSDKYWTSFRLGNLRWLRNKIAESGSVAWVVETEEGDHPKSSISPTKSKPGQVIGWTIWTREGKSEAARQWQRPNETLSKRFEQLLFKVEAKYCDWMPNVNPTWDQQHNKNIGPILREEWDHDIFPEAWVLEGCYIDEQWQRMGVGSMLARWGLQQAKEEGVPVVVKASPLGLGMYEKHGFRRVKKLAFDQWFEPGGEGCWALVWEPEGSEGRWWERAVEREREKEREVERK